MFVALLFKNEEYVYTSFACLFVSFVSRRDPSQNVTTFDDRYGSGELDMYRSKLSNASHIYHN